MAVVVEIEAGVGEVERVVAEEAAGATIGLNLYIESRPMSSTYTSTSITRHVFTPETQYYFR